LAFVLTFAAGLLAGPVHAAAAQERGQPGRPETSSSRPFETGAGSFNAVSCPTSTDCVAFGTSNGDDSEVNFDGSRWGSPRLMEEYAGEVVTVSCPTEVGCVALTDQAMATVLRNERWSSLERVDAFPGPPHPGIVVAVSCSSPHFCAAVDAEGNAEDFDGRAWTRPLLVDASGALDAPSPVPAPTRA
jgi:hypothetical protein